MLGMSRTVTFINLCLICIAVAQPSPATQLSDAQMAVAVRLEEAMKSGDESAADATFDKNELLRRITAGLILTPKQSAAEAGMMGPEFTYIAEGKRKGTQFRLLRVRFMKGEWRALYRTITSDGGFNYSEYVMVANALGQWRFADLYTIALGDMQSTLQRQMLITSLAIENGNLAALSQFDKDCIAHSAAPGQMNADLQAGKYAGVLATYHALPPSMRESRMFLYLRLTAAVQLLSKEPQAYTAAAGDFRRLFPNDPVLDMVNFQAFVQAKNMKGLFQAIDHLQEYAGGDPYLLWIKGHYEVVEGGAQNLADAALLFHRAIDAEPTLRKPHFELLDLSLATRDYELTASTLDAIQTNLGVQFHDLTQIPAFSEFVKSDAFRKWLRKH